MKDVAEHQLLVECLDLIDCGILLLDSFLKDLITTAITIDWYYFSVRIINLKIKLSLVYHIAGDDYC